MRGGFAEPEEEESSEDDFQLPTDCTDSGGLKAVKLYWTKKKPFRAVKSCDVRCRQRGRTAVNDQDIASSLDRFFIGKAKRGLGSVEGLRIPC